MKQTILAGGLLKEADYVVRRYTAKIPVTHTLEDVERPGYLNHHVDLLAKVRSFGPVRLEVMSDDCSIHAEYLVMEATKGGVKLRREIVYHGDIPKVVDDRTVMEAGATDTARFRSTWGGPHAKYRIFEFDNLVAEKIQSKDTVVELVDKLNAFRMNVGDLAEEYAPPPNL